MFRIFTNNNGSAMIGFLLAILIIAALVFGGSFIFKGANKNEANTSITDPSGAIDALGQAREDIDNINSQTEDRGSQIIDEDNSASQSTEEGDEEAPDTTEARMTESIGYRDSYNDPGQRTVSIIGIKSGDRLTSPVVVQGQTGPDSDTVVIELRNQDHMPLVQEEDKVRAGTFEITLHFQFSSTKEGYVAAYDKDNGSLAEIPVKFGEEGEMGEDN